MQLVTGCRMVRCLMKTVALRYAEMFAPDDGTIALHQALIDELGYAWYGKLGNPISQSIAREILESADPRILLIHSGGQERYWAHVADIQRSIPDLSGIPSYYRGMADKFKCWFKVTGFTRAENSVMSSCIVVSSGNRLTDASRHSMSPYFIIDYTGEVS